MYNRHFLLSTTMTSTELDDVSQKQETQITLPDTTVTNYQLPDANPKKTKFAIHKIPAFGIICALLSATFFTCGQLIAKKLTELHSLEILATR